MTAILSTHGLVARYGDFQALFGLDFERLLWAGSCGQAMPPLSATLAAGAA